MARSRKSRASSTPRFEAASSSTTSRFTAPVQTRVQESHSPHGSPAVPEPRRSQLSAIARIRAAVVLPTPRGPANRYPCATRPAATAPRGADVLLDDQVGELFGTVLSGERDHRMKSTSNVECRMSNIQFRSSAFDIGHLHL